jgi:primosomal replication protein N
MADTNKVWLGGIAASRPVLTKLPGKGLPICWFDLLVREDFKSKGQPSAHHMTIRIEALGKQADRVFTEVLEGQRYKVDGYLRWDEEGAFRIRAFAVYPDDSDEAKAYEEGLRSALAIVAKSVDIKAAAEALHLILTSDRKG